MDNIFSEGPCAACYGNSVKTQRRKKVGELHLLVQHPPFILWRLCCSARELKELVHGNCPFVLVRGVTEIITNTQRKLVQNGCTHLSIIELGNPVKPEKEGTHKGLKNPPRASNRALNPWETINHIPAYLHDSQSSPLSPKASTSASLLSLFAGCMVMALSYCKGAWVNIFTSLYQFSRKLEGKAQEGIKPSASINYPVCNSSSSQWQLIIFLTKSRMLESVKWSWFYCDK